MCHISAARVHQMFPRIDGLDEKRTIGEAGAGANARQT